MSIAVPQGIVIGEPGLDFEVLDDGSFRFDVIVSDQAVDVTARRSVTCQVMVVLEDVNDNIPMFDESLYETTVVENEGVGASVIVVSARDNDSGANGDITYNFVGRVRKFHTIPNSRQIE